MITSTFFAICVALAGSNPAGSGSMVEYYKFYYYEMKSDSPDNPYESRNYPVGRLEHNQLQNIPAYFEVYYLVSTKRLAKAKYISQQDHHYTLFYDKYGRLNTRKDYITYCQYWEALQDKCMAEHNFPVSIKNRVDRYFQIFSDPKGRVVKVSEWINNHLYRYWKQDYYLDSNSITRKIIFTGDGELIIAHWQYLYSDQGKLTEIKVFDDKNNLNRVIEVKN